MRERPIIMSAPMVRAILADRKTQTRRALKVQPSFDRNEVTTAAWAQRDGLWMFPNVAPELRLRCPYGHPGDRLWVRETWGDCTPGTDVLTGTKWDKPWYRADADGYGLLGADEEGPLYEEEIKWRSPIHMPRRASRITLEVTGVRVERLQDISEAEAWAEGCERGEPWDNGKGFFPAEVRLSDVCTEGWDNARDWYADLWESINGAGSWESNPWVWVVEFKRAAGGGA